MMMTDADEERAPFKDRRHQGPQLTLLVAGGRDAWEMIVASKITQHDASMWVRPFTICVQNVEQTWESNIDLTREDVRVLRDWLTVLLGTPDWRQGDDTDPAID
jgi:hypothetical protein